MTTAQALLGKKPIAVILAAIVVVGGGAAAAPATLLDDGVQQTDGPSSTVSIQPAEATVDVGETTTVDVVVTSVAGGVGAYNFTVGLSDPSVATISDVSFGGSPGLSETFGSGSKTTARAALADTANTGTVTALTVTLEGVVDGTTDVTLGVNALGDESGTSYEVTGTTGAMLTVAESDAAPATFEVSNLQAPSTATRDDPIDVSADIENTGDESATKTVGFRVDTDGDGSIADESSLVTREVELAAGATETVTFEAIDTSPLAPGTYTHGVTTPDDDATAQITIQEPGPTADVTFADQTTDGTTVVVDSVTMSEGGFVAIHNSSLFEGNVIGSVIGVSEYLAPGTHEDVEITLYDVPGASFNVESLPADEELVAMPHFDTNGNETYDFVATGGEADGPYTADGGPVIDTAQVSVEAEEPEVGYYQIDFIGGEPYEELGPNADNGFYADDDEDRLFRYAFSNTEEGMTSKGTAWPSAQLRGCVEYGHISQDGDTASITFTVNESCADVTLSLAVYEKDEPGFDRDMVQVLSDSDTRTFSPGTYTLIVELPDGDDSEE